jgi:hypothetical protein
MSRVGMEAEEQRCHLGQDEIRLTTPSDHNVSGGVAHRIGPLGSTAMVRPS